MILGSFTYPMIQKYCSCKFILFLGGIGVAILYIGLPLCEPLYKIHSLRYIIVTVLTAMTAFVFAICSSYISVILVKRVNQDYLARIGGITSALGNAAMPVMSFVVGGLVAYISTAKIFVFAGIIASMVGIIVLFSRTLSDKETMNREVEKFEAPLIETTEP